MKKQYLTGILINLFFLNLCVIKLTKVYQQQVVAQPQYAYAAAPAVAKVAAAPVSLNEFRSSSWKTVWI